ncbi:hypothetical protein L3X38_012185 [Prunus dulcis]|uniref:Uncharacterized protein n=1 Tax=Prunus dulcis TaxID=3755 RepID=A0AAD4WJK6_PRUDU|nr:hypothetical protein L3X38_012185 [Prunus dulcis]
MFHNVGLKRNLNGEQACNLGSPGKKHKSHNKANNLGLIQKTATEKATTQSSEKYKRKYYKARKQNSGESSTTRQAENTKRDVFVEANLTEVRITQAKGWPPTAAQHQ